MPSLYGTMRSQKYSKVQFVSEVLCSGEKCTVHTVKGKQFGELETCVVFLPTSTLVLPSISGTNHVLGTCSMLFLPDHLSQDS